MTRFLIVIACLPLAPALAGCFHPHPEGQQEVAGMDCVGCHATDYEATAMPVHRSTPDVYTTSCANCHRMSSWRPALEGAHKDLFVIAQGDHANVACQDCHDLDKLASGVPSKLGANTNCLGCHPDEPGLTTQHDGVTLFSAVPYKYEPGIANFCLECHPEGLAEQHPDTQFARKGNHAVVCSECHDRRSGVDTVNVTCVEAACHTIRETDGTDGHEDGDYKKSKGNGTDRDFCHECH